MLTCCVSSCKNRRSSTSKLKFYRIPCGSRPFQANRRRLWLQAIQEANGSTEELKGGARICGAHFQSQEASMEHDHPDFVPSVFTKKRASSVLSSQHISSFYSHGKRRRRTAKTTETPGDDSPVDFESCFSTEEIQTPSVPKEGEALTEEAESETTAGKLQTTSSPKATSPSFEIPAGILGLNKRRPIVRLKHIYIPAKGYQCDHCDQNFTDVPQLMKHKHLHEEESSTIKSNQADFTADHCVLEPSFPCNICDRSFSTNHNLKRHKLLHVKDGRKCRTCGVLFCQRHNHVLYLPSAETVTEYEEDSTIIQPQNLDSNLMPENHLLERPEPSQTADPEDDAQSTMIVSPVHPKPEPLFEADEDSSPVSHTRISSEIAEPLFLKLSSVSRLPPPVPRCSKNQGASSQFKSTYPETFIQALPPQHLELPPSLKLFSPRYLTSAFLQVKRNYEYILSEPGGGKNNKNVVKEEQCELPLIFSGEQSVEHVKTERTAYDLEIVL